MKFFATWSVKVLWTSCLEKDEKLNIDFQTFIVFLHPYTLATYLIDPFFEIRSVLHTCMSKFGLMFWVIFCHCFQKYLLRMFKRWMKLVEHKQVNTYKTYYRSRGGFRPGWWCGGGLGAVWDSSLAPGGVGEGQGECQGEGEGEGEGSYHSVPGAPLRPQPLWRTTACVRVRVRGEGGV